MKDRVIAINESVYTLTTQKNTNCKSCIYNSKHNGFFDGGCICERSGTYIFEPENCICTSFVNEPMSRKNAINYLGLIGWMQEHDKALTENAVPVVRCKDCVSFHYSGMGGDNGILYCAKLLTEMQPTDFCSYGERKDDEIDRR